MKIKNSFSQKVYRIVRKIPRGKVVTYGQVAAKLGKPKAARAIGNVLHVNPYKDVPCHRVVNREGRLAINFGSGGWHEKSAKRRTSCLTPRSRKFRLRRKRDFAGWREQKRKLLEEGVRFKDERRVDLKKH